MVIPVHTQHFPMLQRNLLYTAMTRGKQLVVLVGTKKAVAMAVKRLDAVRRVTTLAGPLRRRGQNSGATFVAGTSTPRPTPATEPVGPG